MYCFVNAFGSGTNGKMSLMISSLKFPQPLLTYKKKKIITTFADVLQTPLKQNNILYVSYCPRCGHCGIIFCWNFGNTEHYLSMY